MGWRAVGDELPGQHGELHRGRSFRPHGLGHLDPRRLVEGFLELHEAEMLVICLTGLWITATADVQFQAGTSSSL